MKYIIKVVPKFDKNPTAEEFENICDKLVTAVDEMCNHGERSFHVTFPLQEDIDKGIFFYRIAIRVKSEEVQHSSDLFVRLSSIHPIALVIVQETRFCMKADTGATGIYWFHEGETTYHDGSTYISPNYDLYVNGFTDYTVQYVPMAIRNKNERDKQRYMGVEYMWRGTGSWDNFLKATTLDEALKEFENYYHDMLWGNIKGIRDMLIKAEDTFKEFVDYQWRTK